MKLFGVNTFGWRMSSAACLISALPFIYLAGRELGNTRIGFAAGVLTVSSPLMYTFAHLGYNNIQVIPVFAVSIAGLIHSIKCRSMTGIFLSGVVSGLGFYTYYTSPFMSTHSTDNGLDTCNTPIHPLSTSSNMGASDRYSALDSAIVQCSPDHRSKHVESNPVHRAEPGIRFRMSSHNNVETGWDTIGG